MNLFKNLGNLGSLLGQAQQMSGKMEEVKAELQQQRVTGASGGGMVTVEMNGLGEVLSVKLDPQMVESGEREMMESLIPAAVNAAIMKAKEAHAAKLQSLTSEFNLPIPGINEAIAKFAGLDTSGEGDDGPGDVNSPDILPPG